jgi:hypothetical protein
MKADDQYDYYDEEDDGADHDQPQNKKQNENLKCQTSQSRIVLEMFIHN